MTPATRRAATRYDSTEALLPAPPTEALERHVTVQDLCSAWSLSERTVIRLFEEEPGVIKLGTERRRILRIPVSVVERVRQKLSA